MKINKQNYSQASQDLFVLSVLNEKKNGVYVEIGAYQPEIFSNTKLLESDYSWSGISVEINNELVNQFNKERKNNCICADATTIDYSNLFKSEELPKQIDYLSLDVDPPSVTLEVLNKLPLDTYRFSVITYEHESYYAGDTYRKSSREIFEKYGYQLVASNVKNLGNPYEDWWIDPNIVDKDCWFEFVSEGMEHSELLENGNV